MSRSLAASPSRPRSLSPRRPGSMVVSATWASPAGVGDRLPGVVVYGLHGCFDLGVVGDRDRVDAPWTPMAAIMSRRTPRRRAPSPPRPPRPGSHERSARCRAETIPTASGSAAPRRCLCHQRVIAQHLDAAPCLALPHTSHTDPPSSPRLGAAPTDHARTSPSSALRAGAHARRATSKTSPASTAPARTAAPQPLSPTPAAARRRYRAHQHRRHQRRTFEPPRPPTRPRTVSSINASSPSLDITVRQQQPPISHQRPIIEHRPDPVDPP